MAKKLFFHSEKIERFFMSEHDRALYDNQRAPEDEGLDSPFDVMPGKTIIGKPLSLQFTARASDYFRLWVVCQFLTLLTCGLYGPWARTRKARFLAQHWILDDVAFAVNFVPRALLRGRMLAFAILLCAALLGWWNPWLTPGFIVVAFLAAPWLLANSFAFRWRTLKYRGLSFDSDSVTSPLRWPLVALGIALAFASMPMGFLQKYISNQIFLPTLALIFIMPFLVFLPRATAALTHYRFSQASWGTSRFKLEADAKEIYTHMWEKAFSGWMVVFGITIAILAGIGAYWGDRDAQAVLSSIGYLLVSVFGITFARSRRLNFVLHRLSIGGLNFASTIDPSRMSMLTSGYALLAVLTLGLSIPWTTVHFCRWRAAHVTPYLSGEWSQFAEAASSKAASGTLDELGNSFDIEIGI